MSLAHLGQKPANARYTDIQVYEIREWYQMLRQLKYKNAVETLILIFGGSNSGMTKLVLGVHYINVDMPKIKLFDENEAACSVCHKILNKNNFYNSSTSSNELNCRCKDCDLAAKYEEEHNKRQKKLTDEQAYQLRKDNAMMKYLNVKNRNVKLAEKYKIKPCYVNDIISGKVYASVAFVKDIVIEENEKACSICNTIKNKSEYYNKQGTIDSLSSGCIDCIKKSRNKK